MKTAVVTWVTYRNFGTSLQAYALQQTLRKLGHEVKIIDDRRIVRPAGFRWWAATLAKDLSCGRLKIRRLYGHFRRHYMSTDTRFVRRLPDSVRDYEAYICGSDQIWSVHIPVDGYWYLTFAGSCRRIAYAPSTGSDILDTEYLSLVLPYLKNFHAVSVRERGAAGILRRELHREVPALLDPTLLLERPEWEQILPPPEAEKRPYIICYFLSPNDWYIDYVREYARRAGSELRVFHTRPEYASWGRAVDAGPREFVSQIAGAVKVFTDSYHGSIFSILFHRDFVAFERFPESDCNNQNNRITDLFSRLGLCDRYVRRAELSRVAKLAGIDYARTDTLIGNYRKESLEFLRKALDDR